MIINSVLALIRLTGVFQFTADLSLKIDQLGLICILGEQKKRVEDQLLTLAVFHSLRLASAHDCLGRFKPF